MQKNFVFTTTSLVLIGLVLITTHNLVLADSTLLWLNLDSYTLLVGDSVEVVVQVDDVIDLYGTETYLNFNSEILQVVDANPDTDGIQISPGICPQPDNEFSNVADNTLGTIEYIAFSLNPTPPCNGSGDLATVELQCVGDGVGIVNFVSSLLGDINANPIDHSTQDLNLTCLEFPPNIEVFLPFITK